MSLLGIDESAFSSFCSTLPPSLFPSQSVLSPSRITAAAPLRGEFGRMASWTSNTMATASLTAARNTATLSERILRLHLPQCGFRCVTWNTRELLGSISTSQAARERKVKYLVDLVRNNDVICLQETHGKDEYTPTGNLSSCFFYSGGVN